MNEKKNWKKNWGKKLKKKLDFLLGGNKMLKKKIERKKKKIYQLATSRWQLGNNHTEQIHQGQRFKVKKKIEKKNK